MLFPDIERRIEVQNISLKNNGPFWKVSQNVQPNIPGAKNSGKTDQNQTNCENDTYDNDGLNQDPTISAGKEPFHQLMT